MTAERLGKMFEGDYTMMTPDDTRMIEGLKGMFIVCTRPVDRGCKLLVSFFEKVLILNQAL